MNFIAGTPLASATKPALAMGMLARARTILGASDYSIRTRS
jgi:hypothetical protein